MKKQHLFSIIGCIGCLLIVLIAACGDDIDDDGDADDYNNDYDDSEHPRIEYTHIEEALANALGKVPGEEITPAELATLTHLTVPEPHSHWGLPRLTGWHNIALLAHCINLKELDLSRTPIPDLSPLAGLTRLERLNLRNTVIFDLQPLAGLVNLQRLDLSKNAVEDLTALAGLVQLKELYLQGNQISDITPLANLIQLNKLNLHDNMIVDLKPLVDNPGLGNENPAQLEGKFDNHEDVVTVGGNPLSEVSINVYFPALRARGVRVLW